MEYLIMAPTYSCFMFRLHQLAANQQPSQQASSLDSHTTEKQIYQAKGLGALLSPITVVSTQSIMSR